MTKEQAIFWLLFLRFNPDNNVLPNEVIDIAIGAIVAQPERKTGRWIPDDSELGIKCNKCGKSFSDYVNAGTGYMFLEETPNFCPNCEADMKGEQE